MFGSNGGTKERKLTLLSARNFDAGSLFAEGGSTEDIQFCKSRTISLATVSSDILRVSGYTNQFKSLLTSRPALRRESGPSALLQDFDEQRGYSTAERQRVGN
ncbi:unnamed protein product [Gongylonema pulchrum]|uniref:Uncharacterized protein n=1 Tax=Gongylonema pulchrum TaxID=637853 RepID=A0A183EFJ0_9BILA|nr:unnamed protein product [Gongylonema pulchrum]